MAFVDELNRNGTLALIVGGFSFVLLVVVPAVFAAVGRAEW